MSNEKKEVFDLGQNKIITIGQNADKDKVFLLYMDVEKGKVLGKRDITRAIDFILKTHKGQSNESNKIN